MSRYAIVDVANLMFRARHVVRGDAYTKAGMALHIIFRSLKKLVRDQQCDHVVLCLEGGGSWRYKAYPAYKSKRRLERQASAALLTDKEREEEEVFAHVMNEFNNFMSEQTRCTVLFQPGIEGDDFVARWIQLHPNDHHVILSGDSDFIQLIDNNVSIYNGIDDRLLTASGLYTGDGEPLAFHVNMSDGKVKVLGTKAELLAKHDREQKAAKKVFEKSEKEREKLHEASEKRKKQENPEYEIRPFIPAVFVPEPIPSVGFDVEPEWWRKALFVKIIRGDSGDSIFSAYPGVRTKGSKKSIGINEAWEDRNGQGYHWNNFMLQTWEKLKGLDENGNRIIDQVKVLDEFRINESLIDLTKQPQDVKDLMDMVIVDAVQKDPVGNVGFAFLKFCRDNDLSNLAKEANDHARYLNASYSKAS